MYLALNGGVDINIGYNALKAIRKIILALSTFCDYTQMLSIA
jgi:hypothetical protein